MKIPLPPPAAVRANQWRSLNPPPVESFRPKIPITVVIPYYERREALDLTLAALERQTYPNQLFEVVVVDDGSPSPLPPLRSNSMRIRVFHQEDRGFGLSRARNLGARQADHPVLAFLDSDMLPEADWLVAHARWHHVASDLLTLGFRTHVSVAGITASTIRDREGTLGDLFHGRSSERPEWIEMHMARTDDLTSHDDDIFRVVTCGNFGISRELFQQVGGFDESFDRWGMEDTEFGYRAYARGAPLVPVRDAFCWHQGGRGSPDPTRRESLRLQRAKVAHLIPHPDFRHPAPGRSYSVPQCVVTVEPHDQHPETILKTVEELLAGTMDDLVVWVGDRPGDPGYEWLRLGLEPDPRVFIGPIEGAVERFPHSPFLMTLPAGLACDLSMVDRLLAGIGPSAAGRAGLPGGTELTVCRRWAWHRSQRAGLSLADVGEVVSLDLEGGNFRRPARTGHRKRKQSWFLSKATRVLRQMLRVRNPRQARAFLRWIAKALRSKLVNAPHRIRHRAVSPDEFGGLQPAQYPLGAEIAVSGHRASAVFGQSGRIHPVTANGYHDVVLADNPESLPEAQRRVPVVSLSEAAPCLAVPAFDPEQVNPQNWVRHAGGRVGALGEGGALGATRIDRVVEATDRQSLSGLHHLVDTGAFHQDVIRRAATLAAIAATGVLAHLHDSNPRLEQYLGKELHLLMQDERIAGADRGLRERLSVRMRRAALRTHSLRARARQVAAQAGLENHAGLPEVSIILPTRRPALVQRSLSTVAAQTYPRLELVFALHGDGFPAEIDTSYLPFPVQVLSVPSGTVFGNLLNQATEAAGGALITKMDDDDHYDTDHVWDLVLAREHSRAELVAKAAEFVYLQGSDLTLHRCAGEGERYTTSFTIAGGAMLIPRHVLLEAGGWRKIPAGVDQALAKDVSHIGGRVYRTHGHGYLLVRHGEGHTWEASDSYFTGQATATRRGCELSFAGIETPVPR